MSMCESLGLCENFISYVSRKIMKKFVKLTNDTTSVVYFVNTMTLRENPFFLVDFGYCSITR